MQTTVQLLARTGVIPAHRRSVRTPCVRVTAATAEVLVPASVKDVEADLATKRANTKIKCFSASPYATKYFCDPLLAAGFDKLTSTEVRLCALPCALTRQDTDGQKQSEQENGWIRRSIGEEREWAQAGTGGQGVALPAGAGVVAKLK